MLALHVLASGSSGNAAVVVDEATGTAVAVDCGICARDYLAGLESVGVQPIQVQALLITHEHIDHTGGVGVVLRALARKGAAPTVHALPQVAAKSRPLQEVADTFPARPLVLVPLEDRLWEDAAGTLQVGSIRVTAFATSHDAAGGCGFRFTAADGDVLGYVTDTGYLTPAARQGLSGCRILALESNHDLTMLKTGPYPAMLKARVASNYGHLSNDQAAQALEELMWPGLQQVVAMHISQNNNTYQLPVEVLGATVARLGSAAQVRCAYQARIVSVR